MSEHLEKVKEIVRRRESILASMADRPDLLVIPAELARTPEQAHVIKRTQTIALVNEAKRRLAIQSAHAAAEVHNTYVNAYTRSATHDQEVLHSIDSQQMPDAARWIRSYVSRSHNETLAPSMLATEDAFYQQLGGNLQQPRCPLRNRLRNAEAFSRRPGRR